MTNLADFCSKRLVYLNNLIEVEKLKNSSFFHVKKLLINMQFVNKYILPIF